MMEVARAAYLDEVLFAKRTSKERFEILSFIELALRMNADDLGVHVNKHLAKRMFLVGLTISAADIICHLVLAESFKEMMDKNIKMEAKQRVEYQYGSAILQDVLTTHVE